MLTRYGMRISSLLLCCAKNDKPACVVLRGKCSSVDEPVQGSTPALALPGSLTTPTPKHSLIISIVCTIAAPVIRATASFRINLPTLFYRPIELNRPAQNDGFKRVMRKIRKQHCWSMSILLVSRSAKSWMT